MAPPSSHVQKTTFMKRYGMSNRSREENRGVVDAIVVGGGLAGALVARELAEQRLRVRVLDPSPPDSPQKAARVGALYIKPGVDYTPETRFAHQAFDYATRRYRELQRPWRQRRFWQSTGTLQLAWNERERRRQNKLLALNSYRSDFIQSVSADEAARLSGLPLGRGGLWFPRGGVVAIASLRAAVLTHPNIQFEQTSLASGPEQSRSGDWFIKTENGRPLQTSVLIFATGAATGRWFPELPIQSIRGQVSCFASSGDRPLCAISGGGYALPPTNGLQTVGATFDHGSDDDSVRDDSHSANLQSLRNWLPELGERYQPEDIKTGWTGFRSTSPDHLPVAGQLRGLHVIAGLGGKGLAYAPILARLLAESVRGRPGTLDADLVARVAPQRLLSDAKGC